MQTPVVSIIIPVYNVEKYLRQCLDSILNQTYTNWECILVDDGSADSSPSICDEYAEKEKRFQVIHKQNGGVSSARNVGLKNISGKWVTFVDADDQVYPYYLETLLGLTNDECDSVCAGYVKCDLDDNTLYTTEDVKDYELLTYKESIIDFFSPKLFRYNGYVWNRMFRVSVINDNNLCFNENINFSEDSLFVMQFICVHNKKIPFTSRPVYKYYMNPNSVVHDWGRYNNKMFLDRTDVKIAVLKILEGSKIPDAYLLHIARFRIVMFYYNITRELRKYHINDKSIKFTIKKNIKECLPFHYYCLIYMTPFIPVVKCILGKKDK